MNSEILKSWRDIIILIDVDSGFRIYTINMLEPKIKIEGFYRGDWKMKYSSWYCLCSSSFKAVASLYI